MTSPVILRLISDPPAPAAKVSWRAGFGPRAAGTLLFFCATVALASPAADVPPTRAIGIEGHAAINLPRADYRPRPLDDRAELILRIENISAVSSSQHRYDFYYMGLEPGSYSLADYLIRPDGGRPDELSNTLVHVQAVLPADHDGQLTGYTPERFPFIGGYRTFLACVAVLWLGGIAAFARAFRTRRRAVIPAVVLPEPSFAERLRPLVEAASAGVLPVDGQAQLERLLIGFWRDKLALPEVRMADALVRLKEHAQAGELLRALERWLHQRGGASAEEIHALLEPYRHADAPKAAEGGAA